jgi:hypothetical protein
MTSVPRPDRGREVSDSGLEGGRLDRHQHDAGVPGELTGCHQLRDHHLIRALPDDAQPAFS